MRRRLLAAVPSKGDLKPREYCASGIFPDTMNEEGFFNAATSMEQDILQKVLDEFQKLTEIPRPSGHEKKVSDYLAKRLRELGLTVKQDEYNNVIADKKAAPGFENVPLTMLQAHMDMVCVAEKGVKYDPQNDPIKVKNDGKYLTAEGTSLGADDGIGVASIIYLMAQKFDHGPLRVVFTADEETGMTGARGLSADDLKDVRYVINCDSEEYDVATVGSAGSVRLRFERDAKFVPAIGDSAAVLEIKNLLGGHSGMVIMQNRANAIKALGVLLYRLHEAKVEFGLCDIEGGVAENAVAPHVQATICYWEKDKAAIEKIVADFKAEMAEAYEGIEEQAKVGCTATQKPSQMLENGIFLSGIMLINAVHSGVYAVSRFSNTLPQLSANIGKTFVKDGKFEVLVMARSAADANLSMLKTSLRALAAMSGFNPDFGATSPAWNGNPDSLLPKMAKRIFEEQNNHPMTIEFTHGGLECNYFISKNHNMDIVSIGPNNKDIHSPQECLELCTIVPQVRLMQSMLEELAQKEK